MSRLALAAAALLTTAAALVTATPALADDRYALGLFHFNIQYVAGGMVGYWAVPNPAIDLTAEQIEDMIVTQSFAPVLELYAAHPTWGVDIELQGYMLDVLAARHQDTLGLLRSLAKSGQIEVVSFHYSDQFFIGHPTRDWATSQARTAKTFARYDVPLGTSVFCQEGQSDAAMAAQMTARGYATMVWPKNLWNYQHGDFSPDPLYRFGDAALTVGGQSVDFTSGAEHIQTAWTYLDDGELMATGGIDPYFPDIFKTSPSAVAAYEASVAALEAQGYAVTTVEKYAAAVAGKFTPSDPPPLIDGTWQPGSTDSVHRWLGGGGLWTANERDNDVHTIAVLAHRELAAAATLAAAAGLDASATLDDAERLLELGEGSDATGVNPFRGEVEYGIAHEAEVLRIARDVIREAKAMLGEDAVVVDPAAGLVTPGTADPLRGAKAAAPFALTITPGDRSVSEAWESVRPGLDRVEIHFGPGDAEQISVRFPGTAGDPILTTHALDDGTPVSYPRSDFTFDHFWLALPTGLVGLGGGAFVIEDQGHVHVAAEVFDDNPDVVFEDDTQTSGETAGWVFYVLQGTADDAVAFASSLNDERALSR